MLEWASPHTVREEPLLVSTPSPSGFPSGTGILETYTVLHTPPEGFASPLVLGLIRDPAGNRIFARGIGHDRLKIDRQVYIRPLGGITYFTQRSMWRKAKVICRKNYRKYNRRVSSVVHNLVKKAS